MKITALEVTVHERPSPIGGPPRDMVALQIMTDDGINGRAFLGGPGPVAASNAAALAEIARPALIGRDPSDRGALWTQLWAMRARISVGVVGAIDVALWDLAASAAGLPIHRLMGSYRTQLPAYLSSWVHQRPEDYADEAQHYQQAGFQGYKLHPPTQRRYLWGESVDLGEDIEAIHAVRDAVGDSMTVMFDSPHVYTFEEALRIGAVLEECGVLWFEDPLPTEDVYGYTRLRERLRIPFMATEMTGDGPYGFAPWIHAGATDYLRGDAHYKGGLTALMRIAHTAEAFRLGFEVHDGFTALGTVAGIHASMAAPSTRWVELLTIQPTGTYGLKNASWGLAEQFTVDAAGMVTAPEAPGLGVALDTEALAHTRVAVL